MYRDTCKTCLGGGMHCPRLLALGMLYFRRTFAVLRHHNSVIAGFESLCTESLTLPGHGNGTACCVYVCNVSISITLVFCSYTPKRIELVFMARHRSGLGH